MTLRRTLLLIALLSAAPQLRAQGDVPPGDGGPTPVADESPAYTLSAGSFARSRIVALGRDLRVDGEAMSHAVAISGDARVTGSVAGDLIVLGGVATRAADARVDGDVYVLGGDIDLAPGAVIGGRSVAYPEASDLWVALIEGPSLGLPATSRVVVGARLALLAFWTFLMLCLLGVFGREVLATSEAIQDEPFHHFFVGLTGVAALVLTALFFSAFSGALLGVPLLVLVAVVALVLRFWGMVAIFHAVGSWVNRRLLKRQVPAPLVAATWGLVALGVL
ncbi:MAG: polymer-forming cytoskeletal protein, partial [Acidobacteriota bacterium]